MSQDIVVIGGFHEIVELCEENGRRVVGIVDAALKEEYCGVPVFGDDDFFLRRADLYKKYSLIVVPDVPRVRKFLVERYRSFGFSFASLVSKDARISRSATLGEGVVVQAGVNVSAYAKIGDFVKLNTNANAMHDVQIGDYVSVAPNAVLLGSVSVGERAYVGANSTILPCKKIGVGATVGAGAVVTKDVPDFAVVAGVPAQILKYHREQ